MTLSYFMNPLIPFSAITNTIVPPNTGASMKFSEASGEWEQMGVSLNEKPDFNVKEFEDDDSDGDSSDGDDTDEGDDGDDDDDDDADDGDDGKVEERDVDPTLVMTVTSSRDEMPPSSLSSSSTTTTTTTPVDVTSFMKKRDRKRKVPKDGDDAGNESDLDSKIVTGAAPDPSEFA